MLLLADVDHDVVRTRAFADDLALVHRHTRADEHPTAILRVEQPIGARIARFVRDEASRLALGNLALKRLIAVEDVVHHAVAARVGHELAAVTHQTARRNQKLQPRAGIAERRHIGHLRLAHAELFHDRADVLLRHVDRQFLDRLGHDAVFILVQNDLRTGHRKFIALTAHLLDQNRKVQLASAADAERVGGIRFLDAHRDVRLDLVKQAIS